MYQFFIESENAAEKFVTITGSDVNHIKNVLRMKIGEKIRVSTKDGHSYFCSVCEITEDFVRADILHKDETGTELPCRIFLFQGLPKSDKMDWIIQKAVELGVYEIIPVAMKNCVVKLDEKKAKAKVTRWQAIAESAAKQSKRSVIPEVKMPMTFSSAASYAKECKVRLVPYENEHGMAATKKAVSDIQNGQDIAVFIGPEGGFSQEEIDCLKDDMQLVSLGKRILRTETAGMAMLSILIYKLET